MAANDNASPRDPGVSPRGRFSNSTSLALEAEVGANRCGNSCRAGQKRPRTIVIMEPGSLLSSISASPKLAMPRSNRESQASPPSRDSRHSSGPAARVVRLMKKSQPQKIARKVSFDPLSADHGQAQLPVRVSPESGRPPKEDRVGNSTSREANGCFGEVHTHLSSSAGVEHAMFHYFQPPYSKLAPRVSVPNGSSCGQPCAVTTHSHMMSVSFSHEDLEPLPLYQQESGLFSSSMTVNTTNSTASTLRCKKEDRTSMDSSGFAASTRGAYAGAGGRSATPTNYHYQETLQQQATNSYNKRPYSCDEDEYPSWEIFADIENVPSDLRDDDVLNYLESNNSKDMASAHNHVRNAHHWDNATALSYTATTTATATDVVAPSRKPSSSPSSSPSNAAYSEAAKATTKQQPERNESNEKAAVVETPSPCTSTPMMTKPFAMVQKKSRFKHYKNWGVLGTWGIRDVKKKLREFNLSTSGNKVILLDRLREAFAKEC